MTIRWLVAFLATAFSIAMVPAFAVDEVIVTAQRREQPLQDVPLAVSAFNAASIESRQIDVVQDIGQNVPNLQTYTVTAGGQALQVHSRGASIQNPGFNLSESPVGIYQDDVYFGRLASANLELTDIERIEVLRGPQGTLYGRNTIAGAINVISRTPGSDPWIDASLGYGNYDTMKVTASLGGPIADDSLAGSVAVVYDKRNTGWQDNPATDSRPGEYENKIGRAKLHWYGTENFDAVLAVWGADVKNDGYNGVPYVPFSNPPGPDENFLPAPAGGGQTLGGFYDNFSPAGVNYGKSNQYGSSLTLNWDVGGVTLRSISGYINIDDKFGFDLAGGGFLGVPGMPGLLIASDSSFDQVSQELQVLGTAFNNRLKYLGGLFYLNENGKQQFSGDFAGPAFAEDIHNETNSYAAFADGTLKVTDRFSVTAGVRWTRDEKDYSDNCVGPFCFDDSDLTTLTPGTGSVSRSDSWDETTFRAGVSYDIDAHRLVYLNFSQGFQSGGYRTLCFGDLSSDNPATPALEGCGGTAFDPQTVDSYELGYKADVLNNKLMFNADLFYAMYDGLQQIVIPEGGAGVSFPIDNIGSVDVYGAELEVQWSPTDTINIHANAGYQESNFGSVDPNSPPGGLNGNAPPTKELPSNPQFQGKVGFDYTIPVSAMVKFFYGADLFVTDSYFSEARNLVKIDSYRRLNGFLGIRDPDNSWQITVAGTNIMNTKDNVSGIFVQNATNIRTPLPPSEYMLTFKVNY